MTRPEQDTLTLEEKLVGSRNDASHETVIEGMIIRTRFPWKAFDKEWQKGMIDYARQAYTKEAALGREVERVAFDHVNVKNKTFQPRIDFKQVFDDH